VGFVWLHVVFFFLFNFNYNIQWCIIIFHWVSFISGMCQIGERCVMLNVTPRQILLRLEAWKVLEWHAVIFVRRVQLQNADAGKILIVPGRG